MSTSGFSFKKPVWWDRELDPSGKPLRQDVRDAAHDIWERAYLRVQAILGDSSDAANLMERSVVQVSRYLDRRLSNPYDGEVSAILMSAFCRALRRHVVKLQRIELIGRLEDFAEPVTPPCCGPS
jgi:hypothetical protein